MVFHEGFTKNYYVDTPNWFSKRAEIYKEVSTWVDRPFDKVYFDFSAPYCGWIDVSVYVNGKKRHMFPLTAAFSCLHEIKTWLEDIIIDTKLSSDVYLNLEGRTAILHYEHIRLAEVGCRMKFVNEDSDKDEWESYDANNGGLDTGLFYLYDSACKDIPVVCYCRTKQFIFSLYNSLLYYSSRGKYAHLIGREWFYEDHDDDGNPTENRWTFYKRLKSPLIEWNYDSTDAFRHKRPKFEETPVVKETVHMYAERGDRLFWNQQGECCGNAESFFVDTNRTKVNLSDMPEVRTWYNQFDGKKTLEEWSEEKFVSWFNQGWKLAKKIRQRLPLSVDLYYHREPFALEDSESGSVDIPIIVPDDRLLIKRKR